MPALRFKDQDFQAFLDMIAEASLRQPMRILAYCLMPNHYDQQGQRLK
jgi:hypothetical protein